MSSWSSCSWRTSCQLVLQPTVYITRHKKKTQFIDIVLLNLKKGIQQLTNIYSKLYKYKKCIETNTHTDTLEGGSPYRGQATHLENNESIWVNRKGERERERERKKEALTVKERERGGRNKNTNSSSRSRVGPPPPPQVVVTFTSQF